MTEARPLAVAAGAAVRWRGAGLVGAKLLGVLRSVALAWLLVPDDFGLFAVALLPLDAVLCATDVGMLPALVQKRQIDNRDFDVAWTIGIARAVTVGIALFLAAPLAARLLGDPRATRIIQLVALRPLIAALASIRLAERERSLQFREIALVDLATAAVQTIVAIALAKVLGVWAMALGMLGGTLAGVTVSYWQAPSLPRFAIDAQRAVTLLRYGRWLMIGSAMALDPVGLTLRKIDLHAIWKKALLVLSAMTVEEAFFRAWLQKRLGLIASTTLFAMAHFTLGQPILLIGVTVISLVIGLTFYRTKNILPGVIAHGVFDAVQLFVIIPIAFKVAGV